MSHILQFTTLFPICEKQRKYGLHAHLIPSDREDSDTGQCWASGMISDTSLCGSKFVTQNNAAHTE